MFDKLNDQPADKILALMQMFRDDPREDKIDLGVGVYKDAHGKTPIMRAVKIAEERIWADQTTKSYTGLAGDPAYAKAMTGLILGDTLPAEHIAAVATPGGTGAVRQAFELIRLADSDATIWVSTPTWPNHTSILKYIKANTASYSYFDPASGTVNFAAMMKDLGNAKTGDIVLLHGCCHNPTGANLNAAQWEELRAMMSEKGLIPMIDLAYQGFGDGLEEDAAATRLMAAQMPETLIAASCSKNFGIYRERTGILIAVSADSAAQARNQKTLAFLNRQNYSFPPDHGARVVTTILSDPELTADWKAELEEMRLGMLSLREELAAELRRLTNSDRFDFLARHRGMFSLLGTTSEKVDELRETNGIYMVGDSRMNIAGLNHATVPILARAIADAGI